MMTLMPVIMLLGGIGAAGYGGVMLATKVPDQETNRIRKEFAVEERFEAARRKHESDGVRIPNDSLYTGIYVTGTLTFGKVQAKIYIMISQSGVAYVVRTPLSPAPAFIEYFESIAPGSPYKTNYVKNGQEIRLKFDTWSYNIRIGQEKSDLEITFSPNNTATFACEFIAIG
jgi:hypothetical protein